MAPLTLEGETLGERHRHYNQLLKDALTNNQYYILERINYNDNDIDNFMKIDIASNKRDVEYILEVLKGEDLLYVSRALKRCRWLVTEQQYAHIINPQYLHAQLFPHMNTKAIKKLMLHIRKHLKDEKRLAEFYDYKHDTRPATAYKWLPNCSFDFKMEVVLNSKDKDIPIYIYKRMYKHSPEFLTKYIERALEQNHYPTHVARLLAKRYPEAFLDVLGCFCVWCCDAQPCNSTITQKMLYKCPDRLVKGFGLYFYKIDIPTFVKHLDKTNDIEIFLYRKRTIQESWFLFEYLQPFLDAIPREHTTKILIRIFRICGQEKKKSLLDIYYAINEDYMRPYQWYQFAPFEAAKKGLQKLINAESCADERHVMLLVLLACARRDLQYIQALLQYYRDKHINEPFKNKIKFVTDLVNQVDTHNFDTKTWSLLNDIFRSMEIYAKCDSKLQVCSETIIIYSVIHDESIPEMIENNFQFNTLKSCQNKLNSDERDKIFMYLYNYLINKLKKLELKTETEFKNIINVLENLWNLLEDWKKEQQFIDIVLENIKQMLRVKKQNNWCANMSRLYKKLGPWRRQLFSESLLLWCSEESCLNVLKHSPQLLEQHSAELRALQAQHPTPRRLLAKLRIYWPHTIAQQWTEEYYAQMNKIAEHKALIQGLFVLLPAYKSIDIIKQYTPVESKIQWGEANEVEISLRKHIAKNMYRVRPLIPTEMVLWYAKGDYLQHAQYSLNAIYYNLQAIQIREHIQKLLVAPVSIQKQGIRLAFHKLETEELLVVFYNAWKSSKNCSIREVLFTSTYRLLCKCKENETDLINDLWKLLKIFIENLTQDDNKIIYSTLGKVNDVPLNVRAEFLMKGYTLLKSLPEKADCEGIMMGLIKYSPKLIEYIDNNFVEDVLLDNVYDKFIERKEVYLILISTYLLCSKENHILNQKMNNVMGRIFKGSESSWTEEKKETVKNSFHELLKFLCQHLPKYVFERQMVLPVSIFTIIHEFFEKHLTILHDYVLLTQSKLTLGFIKVLEHQISLKTDITWDKIKLKSCPQFGEICFKQLNEDVEKHFPSIYMLFAKACYKLFYYIPLDDIVILNIIEHILNKDLVQSYLLAILLIPNNHNNYSTREKKDEISKVIVSHPSLEVRMLYHRSSNK